MALPGDAGWCFPHASVWLMPLLGTQIASLKCCTRWMEGLEQGGSSVAVDP
jgi:hypothetical protein